MILETLLRRMVTGEKEPATRLETRTYTLSRSFSHEPLVPAANPLSPIALHTGRRCATIQQLHRTYASRLILFDVLVGTKGDGG